MDLERINALSIAITAIATLALMIATIYLANVNKKLWLAQDKPWLSFNLKKLDFGIIDGPTPTVLYVKNCGKGPALDIKFKVDLIKERLPIEYESLSPNEERRVVEIPKSATEPPFSEFYINELTYKDINEKPLSQKLQVIETVEKVQKLKH